MSPDDLEILVEIQRQSYARNPRMRATWPEEQALDASRLSAFLERNRYAVLATSRRDGRAQARPIAFLVADGSFWVGSVEGARLRNLRARPWASLNVMDGQADEGEEGTPHVALIAEGPVVLHEGPAFGRARALLEQRWLERHGHGPDWAAAFVELRPRLLFTHDAGAPPPDVRRAAAAS